MTSEGALLIEWAWGLWILKGVFTPRLHKVYLAFTMPIKRRVALTPPYIAFKGSLRGGPGFAETLESTGLMTGDRS